MVVDQRLLKSQMMKYNIGSNVLNKLSEVQQKTQPTNTSVATATDTPITQTRGTQGLQQQPETYKVITNKFPTYDVKDIMGFGPQAVKNQLGFANSMNQYNRLQAQADANTDPNVRYNLTKPELTNKQTLQIQQATPETNEQGLKINKTASFRDLISDLQYVAGQGKNLSFVEFRDLYPEYVENWDKVVDLFESIKANPQYSAEQVTTTAQKAYPELFGINDNYSDSDKMSALKRLYDEMVSNKQNGIQLTQQDIIDRYPEYANTEDINTVMKLQDFINKDKKSTPTFIDVYDISKEFKSLTKGDVEVGNTEKEQIKKDLANLDKLEARQYNYLSDEGKEYVKLLGAAKAITDELKKNYWIPNDVSERDVLQEVKNKYPDIYSQLTNGVSENVQVSDKDRKLLEGGSTAKSAGKYFKGNLLEFIINTEAGLGDLISTLGNANADFYRDLATALGHGDEWNDEKFREGSTLLGDTLTRAAGWQKEDLENAQRYKEFQEENQKSFKQAMKDGDWTTMIGKSVGLIGQTLPALIASAASGGATGVGFATFLPSSYERALEDLEADESIKLTDNQKRGVALLMGSVESAIEEMSLNMMFPGLKAEGGLAGQVLNKIPGMKNALLRFAVQTELGAASESMEEVAQEFSNNLIAKAAGSDRDMGEFKDYRDIFTETFLSSQLISALGGAGEGINQAKINQIQQQIQEQADLRNKVLEGQAIMANDFNEFANAVEQVPGTTTEELQQVWNNAQQKKQDLEQKANNITSNSYNNVNVPTYERTNVKENEQPKLSAKDSQEYTDLLDEMEKNGEITKEDRKKVEERLGIFTRNVEQPKAEGLANIQKTNETKSETSTEEKRNIIDRIVDKGASIVTKTVSAQDKLYKAQEPRMNVLSNKKNLEKRRANSDRANELIVENGYKPTNTEERLNAHQATLNKLWDQVKEQVKQGEGITVDQTPIINALSEYIAEKKKLGIAGIESEIKALERELNAMKKSQEQGKTDLPVLEQKKQVFNDMIDWKEQEASEVYKGGLRLLTHEIGKVEDDLISKIPGEFTKLKQDVGALLDTYEDVFKAHMKNQRSKGIGLTETYSRIEGIGDMLQGIIGVFKGEGGKVISGAGKVLLGKSLARAKDVDFLIKKGFEELSNEMGSNTKNDNDTTTDKNDTPPTKPNKPKNNGPKNQTQPETEKKSEKKTNKVEQVQGMAEINQNKKTETEGLGQISNKENIVSKNQKRINELWNVKEENGVKYIEIDGKKIYNEKTNPKMKERTWKQHQFTNNYIFNTEGEYQEYIDNLNKLIQGSENKVNVSKDYTLESDILGHIFQEHGSFAPENLIETVNDYDDIVYSPKGHEDVNYLLKKIPGSSNFFRATVMDNGVLTFFERVSGGTDLYSKDLAKGQQEKGGENSHPPLSTDSITKISEKSRENETKQEGLATITKEEKRLGNESDYTKDEVFYDQDGDIDGQISKGDKSITYYVDGNTNNTYIDGRSISNFIGKEEGLLGLVAKLEESMKERGLNNLYVEIDMDDYYPDGNVLSEYDKDGVKLGEEESEYSIIENDPRWKSFVNEMEELGFELQDDNIGYKKFYKDTEGSFLVLDEHAGEQPLFDIEKYKEEYDEDTYYKGQANKLDQKQMDKDTIAAMENEDKETDFRETAKNQVEAEKQGLAEISVKVENGKVVKENETEQKSETVETPQEFEVLPADVSVYDESKTTGPKRISPDRGGWWQQLTPKEAIDKKIEQITKDRQRRTEQYDKKLDILNGYIEKFGDSISQNDRSKEATEARKAIRNEIINPYRLGNFFTAGALGQIKEVFERWKSQQNTEITDKNREDINRDYIQHVKEDISHGYRYPEAVLSYNPEFRTAVDNRARYEKGLYTSFSTDDTRIVDYKKDQIGAGMKRQDGKELTQEQKDEIANGVINYQETMGIDIKRLAENNNWVYVHLNGKNPFLMGSQGGIAGLYRGSVDEKGRSTASISVGGTESYQVREDGKIVTKKKKTTMAHELTHALDALSSRKLLSESAYNDLRLKFNDYDSRGLHHSSYWTSKSEITARMVEEYVAVQNGDTEIFNEKGYWDQETYNSVIEPEINKIKNNFFQEYKEGIGGDSIEQIKADAITRGLADISNF